MRAAAAILAVVLLGASGEADTAPDKNIAGSWTFRAALYDDCEFNGLMRLRPTDDARTYACELTARQSCPSVDMEFVVRQSCVARRTGDQLAITSTIEEFLVGEPTPAYYPDNFALSIQSSNRMTGALLSAGDSNAAEFIRDEGSIS
ncbi:MAG: hypothetical protein AAFX03_09370 [Pseudomonadota bacterium]